MRRSVDPARPSAPALTLTLTLALAVAACGQDDDPEGARVLWDKIHEGEGFRSWPRAPGYAVRRPSFTAHKDAVEIFVNAPVADTLQPATPPAELAREWPVGSIIVKEGYSGAARKIVAAMEKRTDGWFWAEYDDGGGPLFSGRPSGCTDCHSHRAQHSDWVYAFELPR